MIVWCEMNSEAQQTLERKVAILSRLTEISAGLSSTMKLKALLSMIMDATAEITGAEAASVLLWDQKANELRFAGTTSNNNPVDLFSKPVPLEGSIAGTVLRENRIMMVNNTAQDPRHYSQLDREIHFHTISILGVPMLSKDRMIGVLEAVNKREPWTEDDGYYVSILASQAAVAIEGAQMVAQLQKVNKELNDLDKLKSDFIAIASHELRTPLGVILGYASFLQDTSDTVQRELADKVMNSGMQLRRIIEDLTNLRYLQTREAELQRVRLPVRHWLQEVQFDTMEMASAKKHRLVFPNVPLEVVVHGDPTRLNMALTNVLNNAIRFTPDGGIIQLRVDVRGSEAVVAVADNGIGLPKDQFEKIFDKFYQVEDHMTRTHGGLGIGLSIAKGLIDAHGGRIWASSPGENQGATFYISLPLYVEPEA